MFNFKPVRVLINVLVGVVLFLIVLLVAVMLRQHGNEQQSQLEERKTESMSVYYPDTIYRFCSVKRNYRDTTFNRLLLHMYTDSTVNVMYQKFDERRKDTITFNTEFQVDEILLVHQHSMQRRKF